MKPVVNLMRPFVPLLLKSVHGDHVTKHNDENNGTRGFVRLTAGFVSSSANNVSLRLCPYLNIEELFYCRGSRLRFCESAQYLIQPERRTQRHTMKILENSVVTQSFRHTMPVPAYTHAITPPAIVLSHLSPLRYTVRIAYKVGGYSNNYIRYIIPDIVINFSNSFSFAITKYTKLSRIVIIVYSNISPIVIKFLFQKTFITLFLHRL